jgi:hypothetical protein
MYIRDHGECKECQQPNTGRWWCKSCYSKRFRSKFSSWTSGNYEIDEFIRRMQLEAKGYRGFIEWIPFDRLQDVEPYAKGGFGSIFKATWTDGYIWYWDRKDKEWARRSAGKEICLKSLNNSKNITQEFLQEVYDDI